MSDDEEYFRGVRAHVESVHAAYKAHLESVQLEVETFMLVLAHTLANERSDPKAWASALIASLHAVLDESEKRWRESGVVFSAEHERARMRFDEMGKMLLAKL